MRARVVISWTTADGEEHEEPWGSVEAFRAWAQTEGLRCAYTAYQEDEDGDLVVLERGEIR